MNASPLLTATGLGRRIDGAWIWRGLDLQLSEGDIAMLVGPTGSGKSLLLRCLCGLDPPDEGVVTFHDKPLDGRMLPDLRRRILYVQQSPVLISGTVEDNVELPRTFRGHRHLPPLARVASELFAAAGKSEGFLAQRSSLLSGGEGQLVGLVRAMVLEPEVLLLDEPTAHLDSGTTERVERLVSRWIDQGRRAVLWTSHDPVQVERVRRGPFLALGASP